MMPIARLFESSLATPLFAAAVMAAGCMVGVAGAAEPSTTKPSTTKPSTTKPVAKAVSIAEACTRLKGVERKICVECDGVPFFKRIGCQQRVFWTTCKGKRLFEDSYCQSHQDQGPPRGEGN